MGLRSVNVQKTRMIHLSNRTHQNYTSLLGILLLVEEVLNRYGIRPSLQKFLVKKEYITPWENTFDRVLTPLEEFIHRQATS